VNVAPRPVHVVVATAVFSADGLTAVAEALPGCASVDWVPIPYDNGRSPTDLPDEWRALLAEAHILLGFAEQFPDLSTLAPQLCWIHQGGAGYEKVDVAALSRHGIGFVSAAGAGSTGIAEFVVLAMLSLARRASDYYRTQLVRQWQRFPSAELAGRRLTVVGAGEIGSRVCRLSAALGLDVTCVRLHTELGVPEGASRVVGPDAFTSILPVSDVVVLAAPLTAQTNLLLGGPELACLPEGALVVNVARAGLIDHGALREALVAGRLGGAWLDVLPEEPLPPDSGLWDAPGLSISSHNAVAMGSYPVNLGRQCARAVAIWLEGGPIPHTVVDVPPVPVDLAAAIGAPHAGGAPAT
jgi:phosphoglycerate dehydrogenase-like enzyme